MTRTVTSPMNSMKRRWWQKMAEKNPSWRGFRKIWFHRWARATFWKFLSGWILFWMIFLNLKIVYFPGNCEARPPLYTCRFPHRPLWGVKSCTGLIHYEMQPQQSASEQCLFPVSKHYGQTWNCGLERKRKIQTVIFNWYIEWNVIHLNSTMVRGCPVHSIHILIFTVVTVQVVCPLPSWYVSSRREYIKLSCISRVSFLQGKTSLMWKGF